MDGLPQPLFKWNTRAEAKKTFGSTDIEGATWLAIRLVLIPDNSSLKASKFGDESSEIPDADLHSRAKINGIGSVISLGGKQNCFGCIINMKELAGRIPRSPQDNLLCSSVHRIHTFSYDCWNRVGGLDVEVVAGAIKIHGQKVDRVKTELLPICLRLHEQHFLG